MTFDEADSRSWIPYRNRIVTWLKERYPSLEVGASTIRTYVSDIRKIYHIPKRIIPRMQEAFKELLMVNNNRSTWEK